MTAEIDWATPKRRARAHYTCAVCERPQTAETVPAVLLCKLCDEDLSATWQHLQARADSVRDQKFAALNVWRDVTAAADVATLERYAATVKARWPMDGSAPAANVEARIAKSRALGDGLAIVLNAEAARDETIARLAEESARIGRGLDEVQKARASAPHARPNEYIVPADATPILCRSCGAGMVFIKTPSGKAMPLSVATIETRDGVRYALPHFADCKDSKLWSKR